MVMKIEFKGVQIDARPWTPMVGLVGDTFSYDTETTALDDPRVVQDYVIGTVYNGKDAFFIRRQDLGEFWRIHQGCRVFMHTASFDLEVTTKACGFDFHTIVEGGCIIDISILYRLLTTAKTGDIPHHYSLDSMTKELLGVELDKNETIRKGFGKFLNDGEVNYTAIPLEYLIYAGLDAIVTFQLGSLLEPECRLFQPEIPLLGNGILCTNGTNGTPFGLLGYDIQLKGDIALRAIEHLGVGVDQPAVEELDKDLVQGMVDSRTVLERYGYFPDKPGTRVAFNKIVSRIARQQGVMLYVTPKSGDVSQKEAALQELIGHEFIDAFLSYKGNEKLRSTYVEHLREAGERIFPRYNLLVRTGRTSCSRPNIQNLPRAGEVRKCIIPTPGHELIACDYNTLELCALAQICYGRYGQSHMLKLINQGVDLHRYVAAMITGKPESEVSKEERQKSKALNFGLPGGMGTRGLLGYAASAYGVHLTEDEAESWRTAWMDLFPEMQLYLTQGNTLEDLGATLDRESFPGGYVGAETAAAIVMRVAGGKLETSTGREFSSEEIDWAWRQIANTPANLYTITREWIEARKGTRFLQKVIVPGKTVTIPTGRVKANCRFTQEHNTPFQGLSADGAKLALYALNRAGYRVVAFIHDEVLVEIPERDDYREPAQDISRIMVEAMRQVCPDVEIRTEFAVMRRWDKAAKAVYDGQGRLIPFG